MAISDSPNLFKPKGIKRMNNQEQINAEVTVMNEKRAAAFLDMKVATLQAWRVRGDGPTFLKLGSAVRYTMEDLKAFIESKKQRTTYENPKKI